MSGTRRLVIGTLALVVIGLSQPASGFPTAAADQLGVSALPLRSAIARAEAVLGTDVPMLATAPSASASNESGGRPGTIGVLPRVLVGATPQDAVFDPATRTVYTANQGDNTMSVVNARTCHARDTVGCGRTAPAFPAGSGPFGLGLNEATHSVYVADSNSDTVTVFNTATCNAQHPAGCKRIAATVKVGEGPASIAVDPSTDSLYVTNTGPGMNGTGDTVSVINGSTCNATKTSGCGRRPATVRLGTVGFLVSLDVANKTLYVTDPLRNAVSMIDTRTCHARDTAGCRRRPRMAAVGNAPVPVVADARTNTIYVGHANDPVVSLINGATCNARHTSGCADIRAPLHVPGGQDGLAMDDAMGTLFVTNNGAGNSTGRSNTVSVVDAATCNARNTSGCRRQAPMVLTGANPGAPVVDVRTDTLYVATFDNALQVINIGTCNAKIRTGCGQTTPAAIACGDPWSAAINPATHTLYVGNDGELEGGPLTISVLNAKTCNTTGRAGCTPNPPTIPMKFGSFGLSIEQRTDTVYATNSLDSSFQPGDTVSVINGATCNSTVTVGCASKPVTVTVGSQPTGLAEDYATRTLYVANSSANTVSVIDAATCNARRSSGCGQTPPQVSLGHSPFSVAVDQATDSIYVLDPGSPGRVSVIDGSTCNAMDTSGCGNVPPAVTVGNDLGAGLAGLAVDQTTDSVYVVNNGDDTVSIINGNTCNAEHTTGCGQIPRRVSIGREGYGFVAVDPATNFVYVSDTLDDTVSIINGNTCNAQKNSGCNHILPTVPAGANPTVLAVNPANDTVYADDIGAGTVSFFRFRAPMRPTGVSATVDHGTVELRWRPPYDGGLPLVYHVIASPACPTCSGMTTPSTSGEPFTLITGLVSGRKYTFRVEASNAAGTGPVSRRSNAVIP